MQCRICKKYLTEFHHECPVCGEPRPKDKKDMAWIEPFLLALAGVLVIVAFNLPF